MDSSKYAFTKKQFGKMGHEMWLKPFLTISTIITMIAFIILVFAAAEENRILTNKENVGDVEFELLRISKLNTAGTILLFVGFIVMQFYLFRHM